MPVQAARSAEVLRAWQKDNLYEKKISSLITNLFPSYSHQASQLSMLVYRSFTTLKDLQTLGEEYTGIVQVDDSFTKIPSYNSRLLSILLSVFGENITRKLLSHFQTAIKDNPSLQEHIKSSSIIVLKTINNILPQIESIHRALCYIYGGPLQISKNLTSINYVQVRPAASAYYAHLRLLGIVTLLHSFVTCTESLYQTKKQMDDMKHLNFHISDTRKCCSACLEEMVQPSALPCGHIFCFDCCYKALENCALCRTEFSRNSVIPLLNYSPGDL